MRPAAALAILSLLSAPALAAPCREGKGSTVKCRAKGGTRLGAAAVDGNIRRDAGGKCRLVKPAPGQAANQEVPCPR